MSTFVIILLVCYFAVMIPIGLEMYRLYVELEAMKKHIKRIEGMEKDILNKISPNNENEKI